MKKKDFTVSGYFKRNKSKFACFDDGHLINAQIIEKPDSFDFINFKKNIIGKVLSISTNFKEVQYDYNVTFVRWLNKHEIEIYYNFRIKKYKNARCHSITFNSEEIDVFGQNKVFLNLMYDSIQTKELNLDEQNINIEFKFDHKKYHLSLYTSLKEPIEMTHNVSFSTFLNISSNEEIETNTVIKLFKLVRDVFSFLTFRKNININKAELKDKFDPLGAYTKPYGELYRSTGLKNHEYKSYPDNPMIKCNSIGKMLEKIFEAVSDKVIQCDYIPNDTDSAGSIFVNVTAWLQSFFRIYVSNNEKYDVKKINVLFLGGNKQKRVCFADMIETLLKESKDWVEEVIQESLDSYLFFGDKEEYKQNFITRIVNIRNDFCHGSVDYENKNYKFFLLDLLNLEILLYGSILKYIGVGNEECHQALRQLFLNLDI